LFMKLEQEVDVQLIDAAVDAGWSAEDALTAIEELRKH
jgi:hypothetical protein